MWRHRITIFFWILLASVGIAALVWATSTGALRWGLLSGLCSLSGLWIGLGVSFPRLQMFGRSLCVIETSRKAVALTFDDGPEPDTTPAVLDLLAERNARATFFCIGHKAQRNPELVRRIARKGHQVENHSFAHSHWTNLFSVKRLRADLEQAQSIIGSLVGKAPTLFRPPIGLTNFRTFKAAQALGLRVTGYTARAFDRRPDPPEQIAARLIRKLRPGAILVLHDGEVPVERATAVLRQVLDELVRRQFECSTIDELLMDGGKPLIAPACNPH